MNLTLIAKPSRYPVSLQEAKDYCRIEDDENDAMILGFLIAATEQAESITARRLVSQQWRLDLEGFCSDISLPYPNLISVDSIQYHDNNNEIQTLATSYYEVLGIDGVGEITTASSYNYPATYPRKDAVQITFTCGYEKVSLIPEGIKTGIKNIIWHLYDNRGAHIDQDLLGFMFGPYVMRGFV